MARKNKCNHSILLIRSQQEDAYLSELWNNLNTLRRAYLFAVAKRKSFLRDNKSKSWKVKHAKDNLVAVAESSGKPPKVIDKANNSNISQTPGNKSFHKDVAISSVKSSRQHNASEDFTKDNAKSMPPDSVKLRSSDTDDHKRYNMPNASNQASVSVIKDISSTTEPKIVPNTTTTTSSVDPSKSSQNTLFAWSTDVINDIITRDENPIQYLNSDPQSFYITHTVADIIEAAVRDTKSADNTSKASRSTEALRKQQRRDTIDEVIDEIQHTMNILYKPAAELIEIRVPKVVDFPEKILPDKVVCSIKDKASTLIFYSGCPANADKLDTCRRLAEERARLTWVHKIPFVTLGLTTFEQCRKEIKEAKKRKPVPVIINKGVDNEEKEWADAQKFRNDWKLNMKK